MEYNFKEVEKKWQSYWKENQTYKVDVDPSKPKFYVLDMFPYPSGAGLHVGHPLGYIASDIYSRYKRLKGFNVLHPMGFDAYGLPAEQYAIQTGQHPAITTEKNIARYREQLDKIGFSFDWDREVRTCDPKYYKWTQWAFIQMFNHWFNKDTQKAEPIAKLVETFEKEGNANINAANSDTPIFTAEAWKAMDIREQQRVLLNYRIAYLADTMVNWCPQLGTVLANDEVKEGLSVRGGFPVVQKNMRQWSLRVSAYAQRLLDGLNHLEWSDSLKDIQRNWIGRSQGADVIFDVKDSDIQLKIFTTRPDTIYGVSFMVLAPESDYVRQLTTPDQEKAVAEYLDYVAKRTERERQSEIKTVTGVFTGSYAMNPFTNEAIPVWISEYVLAGYGTGAIMAVPAHDSRDYAFARKFNLPVIPVIDNGQPIDLSKSSYDAKEGKMINSGLIDGMEVKEAIAFIAEEVEKRGIGKSKINYRLRDAIFSRQRYWGEPFPVYYKDSMPYMIDEAELPLELPEIDKYLPTENGEPPLGRAKNWTTKEGYPIELNTMPGFAGSSAYYLRYMDPHNDKALASPEALKYWSPVDWYNGGMEHTTLHLLYSRFWHKFLYDIGVVPTKEPYAKRTSHGMILGENGEKMSKSRGNVVNPDEIVDTYGADTMRLYEMFIGDFEKAAPWSPKSIKGCRRFLERVWALADKVQDGDTYSEQHEVLMNRTIKKVGEDADNLKANTAIAALMTMLNEFYDKGVNKAEYKTFLALLNPFAPHITEELWQQMGETGLLSVAPWPTYDEAKTVESMVELAVQVNGKLKCTIKLAVDADKQTAIDTALAEEKVQHVIEGKQIVKQIVVPGKIVNLVVK